MTKNTLKYCKNYMYLERTKIHISDEYRHIKRPPMLHTAALAKALGDLRARDPQWLWFQRGGLRISDSWSITNLLSMTLGVHVTAWTECSAFSLAFC